VLRIARYPAPVPLPWRRLATPFALAALLLTAGGCASSVVSAGPATSGSATSTPSAPTPIPAPSTSPRDSSPVVVVGMGDSVTAGTACSCSTFVDRYAAMLHQHSGRAAAAVNLGQGGLTSVGLGSQLASPGVRTQLARATVVVLTIGANDLESLIGRWQSQGCPTSTCIDPATAAMGSQLGGDLRQVRAETSPSARVLVTTYWNVFEDGDVGEQDYGKAFHPWSDAVTKSANAQICSAAQAAGDTCVDLYTPFEGAGERNPTDLLADDGDHPNAQGHELIAEALLKAEPLEPVS
jgi:lysophospholipase L1-like esterase